MLFPRLPRPALSAALLISISCSWLHSAAAQQYPLRWWKGNLHTHTLWSDGDDFPEMSADWYRARGYNFLALTDHNVLSQGMRWMNVKKIVDRGGEHALKEYIERFGDQWVETRGSADSPDFAVRLKPFDEYRYLLEKAGEFILIPAEEISDRAEGKPVHMNATNLAEVIAPVGGATVQEAIANNFRAVDEQAKRLGREIILHLNHPNFGWAVKPEDIARVTEEQFFEVYNGHPGVNHLGDETRPSVEDFWDLANVLRLTVLNADPLLGIATDDTHDYHGNGGSRPGRGWVMVRARYLSPEHLIRALRAGDFYCSSGVTLSDVQFDETSKKLSVSVEAKDDEQYRIDFVASLTQPDPESPQRDRIGKVMKSVTGTTGSYTLTGDELYVRAVVTSSAGAVDPSFADQKKQAWTQPVGWSTSKR